MEGVRHRKVSENEMLWSRKTVRSPSKLPVSFQLLKFLFYVLIFTLTALIILVTLNNTWPLKGFGHSVNSLDRVSVAFGVQERVYAVVIDAGSTGSRVLAFTFYRSLSDNTLKLADELWEEAKPGLSSYADTPVTGAESLKPLLDLAKSRIPQEKWSSTPLVLKATAGLRLLPADKADSLLAEVAKVLDGSGFHTTENSVGIMDGRDEGIFSWFTVNYLLDRVAGDPKDTLVALDLGGGSTQVTFVPAEEETLKKVPDEYVSSISLLHQNVNLFTHSYLGLGLMSGRKAVFEWHRWTGNIIQSPCVNPIIDTEWDYGGEKLKVKGPTNPRYLEVKGEAGRLTEKRPVADYEACYKTCTDVITKAVADVPDELKNREVIAFSYFFDRATERGLIDPFKGGIIKVGDFITAAKQSCGIPNVEQPFACLDLTYIAAFFIEGYGLSPQSTIKLYKKIDGFEVSWGLGLAFHIINNGI